MFAAARELYFDPHLTPYLIVIGYFWLNWTFKLCVGLGYRPIRNNFESPLTVIMPVYNEDRAILLEAVQRIAGLPASRVAEFIIITDQREPDIIPWFESQFGADERLRFIEGTTSGKRHSVRLGIELATQPIVVAVDSDVLIRPDSFDELIRPFADPRVGGVVGDQEVHEPLRNVWTFLDFVCEKTKYTLLYPALSVGGQVTVLSGRTVAYRREAVLPLLHDLTNEKFFGRTCISGDDGRMSSLLLRAGWKTRFQSTSLIESVAPGSFKGLLLQRTRWYRNSARRTLRAMFWDGMWVWRRPLAAWQMLTTWLSTIMVAAALYLLGKSIATGHFFWFGDETAEVAARLGLLTLGLALTRFLRAIPAWSGIYRRSPGWRWLLFIFLPFYLLVFWAVRVRAIFTMNKQGWVTRQSASPGGLG